MSGHWYDGIGSGIGSMVDALTGSPGGSTAMGASAASTAAQHHVAGSDTAQTLGKATGLSPYMKMFGMTPTETGGPTEDEKGERMATRAEMQDAAAGRTAPRTPGAQGLGSLWDTVRGKGDHWSSPVTGDDTKQGFKPIVDANGKTTGYEPPSYQNWGAVGRSGGNRQSDLDARNKPVKVGMSDPDDPLQEEGNKVVQAPTIYQPDLSGLKHVTTGQQSIPSDPLTPGGTTYKNVTGAGRFTDETQSADGKSAWASKSDGLSFSPKTTIDPLTGKGMTSFASGGYAAGAEYKTGYRAVAMSDDKRYTADAEAGLVANAGLNGKFGLDTKNGLYGTAGIGAKAGAYAQANANAKTGELKIGGVDYDAGIGAHAETFAGAKAGAGATVGIGPDFVGAKGNIGAFVGAEAAGDIHANLGPLAGKVGASGMVGAGIGADGDLSYKDGKFHIGGKMFAALGYGGSLSMDTTVDVGAIGKSAINLGSTGLDYAGKGLNAAGKGISTGIDATGKAINTGIDYAGTQIHNGVDATGKAINSGIDYAGKQFNSGVDATGKAINTGIDYATKGIENTGKSIYNAGATGIDYASKGLDTAGKTISNVGAAGLDMASRGASAVTSGISNGASSLAHGAASLFSW